MTSGKDYTRDLPSFRLSLERAGFIMQKLGGANQTQYFWEFRGTIASKYSHCPGCRLDLAKASKEEVK